MKLVTFTLVYVQISIVNSSEQFLQRCVQANFHCFIALSVSIIEHSRKSNIRIPAVPSASMSASPHEQFLQARLGPDAEVPKHEENENGV